MGQLRSLLGSKVGKRLLWAVGIIAFLLMLYVSALPGDFAVGRDNTGELPGVYTVNGTDPIGTEYSGTMVIAATDRSGEFEIEWIVTGAIQRGTGFRSGQEMIVEWSEVNNATGDGTGTTVYQILPNGELIGTWRATGFTDPGTERVFPEA